MESENIETLDFDNKRRTRLQRTSPFNVWMKHWEAQTTNTLIISSTNSRMMNLLKKRTDHITNFLPKYNQVFSHFTDHNEIVYKARDGYTVRKPNKNVIRHVVKGKIVKFDDIVTQYTSPIHFYHDFGFYPCHKDPHGNDCPPNMLNIWNGFQG